MKRIKDYTDKEGNKWEVYTRDVSFWRYYYMGVTESGDHPANVATTIKLAFGINKDEDYHGHKKEVIKKCLENYAEENLYSDIKGDE